MKEMLPPTETEIKRQIRQLFSPFYCEQFGIHLSSAIKLSDKGSIRYSCHQGAHHDPYRVLLTLPPVSPRLLFNKLTLTIKYIVIIKVKYLNYLFYC